MNAVYIHIPFCQNICSYCDFSKLYYNSDLVLNYLEALNKEVKNNYQGEKIDTLYIGGGTPTSLSLSELKILFQVIGQFNLSENCEITIECNIESTTLDKLKFLKDNGVSRLSFGIQSFNQKHLNFLERKHTSETAFQKIKESQELGFDNINIDLIYALPNQTIEELKSDLDMVLDLKIQHISCYSLIIEEHTKIYNKVKDIDEDLNYQMYCLINKTLSDHNFDHYEISNYAQSGFVSRHNLKYWTNQQYYGFGLSAAAHNNKERTINTKNISEYLKYNYIYEREKLTPELKMEYEVMLGLRLLRGIDIENLVNKYKIDFYNKFPFDKLVQEGYLIKNNNKISVSENNLFRLNEILINLLDLNQKEDE